MNASSINHLLYADDVVVFANGSGRSIRCVMDVLKDYECWSGQRVNYDKSVIFFFSKHLLDSRVREIQEEIGFFEGLFPFTYLGAPIVDG